MYILASNLGYVVHLFSLTYTSNLKGSLQGQGVPEWGAANDGGRGETAYDRRTMCAIMDGPSGRAGATGTVGLVLTGPLLRSSPAHRFRLN